MTNCDVTVVISPLLECDNVTHTRRVSRHTGSLTRPSRLPVTRARARPRPGHSSGRRSLRRLLRWRPHLRPSEHDQPPLAAENLSAALSMTRYTRAQEAEVQLLASQGLTQRQIATRTRIHARKVSRVLSAPASVAVVRVLSEHEVTEHIRSILTRLLARLDRDVDDPSTPTRDIIRGVEVLAPQLSLRTGGPTSRTEVADGPPALSVDEGLELARWLDAITSATDEQLAEQAEAYTREIRDKFAEQPRFPPVTENSA